MISKIRKVLSVITGHNFNQSKNSRVLESNALLIFLADT